METANAQALVERFVNVWNLEDAEARRAEVQSLWAADGHYMMGAQDVRGHEALEARVAASHERSVTLGGNRFRPAGFIQAVPGAVKFRWEMARRATDEVTSAGVGFLMVDDAGQVKESFLFAEA